MSVRGRLIESRSRRRMLGVVTAVLSSVAEISASLAQAPTKVWRIGVLNPRAMPVQGTGNLYIRFFEELRDLGYVEGRNVAVQWETADNDLQRLPALAAHLVKSKVDLIITNGSPAVRAAQQATATIPIVALAFVDPVVSGFAKTFARPGNNITGITTLSDELEVKRLEILVEIVPNVTRIAYLFNPDNPIPMRWAPALVRAASKASKEIVIVHARGEHELNAAFAQMIRDRAGAALIAQDSVFDDHLHRIGELALQHKLPSVSYGGASTSSLVNYQRDGSRSLRSAAMMVVKIFKGAKPADMPIEQPTHFTIMVNLNTAKALGITIPPAVMVQATRVIE